ncbi:MAG: methionyl-tRNA formyltransferase, partial [Candidatus Uhrbacteria bacterium]
MTSVVFFGTPDFSIPFLDALHSASNFDIVGVVTQPDKPVGRKQVLTPSPVKVRALELELPVLELKNLKSDRANSKLKTLNPAEPGLATPGSQLFVVVAYGKIIPASILELAPAINVHPSLLPKYRGPSPMQSAILNGDAKTGISIMLLNQGMDSGPIL